MKHHISHNSIWKRQALASKNALIESERRYLTLEWQMKQQILRRDEDIQRLSGLVAQLSSQSDVQSVNNSLTMTPLKRVKNVAIMTEEPFSVRASVQMNNVSTMTEENLNFPIEIANQIDLSEPLPHPEQTYLSVPSGGEAHLKEPFAVGMEPQDLELHNDIVIPSVHTSEQMNILATTTEGKFGFPVGINNQIDLSEPEPSPEPEQVSLPIPSGEEAHSKEPFAVDMKSRTPPQARLEDIAKEPIIACTSVQMNDLATTTEEKFDFPVEIANQINPSEPEPPPDLTQIGLHVPLSEEALLKEPVAGALESEEQEISKSVLPTASSTQVKMATMEDSLSTSSRSTSTPNSPQAHCLPNSDSEPDVITSPGAKFLCVLNSPVEQYPVLDVEDATAAVADAQSSVSSQSSHCKGKDWAPVDLDMWDAEHELCSPPAKRRHVLPSSSSSSECPCLPVQPAPSALPRASLEDMFVDPAKRRHVLPSSSSSSECPCLPVQPAPSALPRASLEDMFVDPPVNSSSSSSSSEPQRRRRPLPNDSLTASETKGKSAMSTNLLSSSSQRASSSLVAPPPPDPRQSSHFRVDSMLLHEVHKKISAPLPDPSLSFTMPVVPSPSLSITSDESADDTTANKASTSSTSENSLSQFVVDCGRYCRGSLSDPQWVLEKEVQTVVTRGEILTLASLEQCCFDLVKWCLPRQVPDLLSTLLKLGDQTDHVPLLDVETRLVQVLTTLHCALRKMDRGDLLLQALVRAVLRGLQFRESSGRMRPAFKCCVLRITFTTLQQLVWKDMVHVRVWVRLGSFLVETMRLCRMPLIYPCLALASLQPLQTLLKKVVKYEQTAVFSTLLRHVLLLQRDSGVYAKSLRYLYQPFLRQSQWSLLAECEDDLTVAQVTLQNLLTSPVKLFENEVRLTCLGLLLFAGSKRAFWWRHKLLPIVAPHEVMTDEKGYVLQLYLLAQLWLMRPSVEQQDTRRNQLRYSSQSELVQWISLLAQRVDSTKQGVRILKLLPLSSLAQSFHQETGKLKSTEDITRLLFNSDAYPLVTLG